MLTWIRTRKKNSVIRDRYDELIYKKTLSTSEKVIEFIGKHKEYKPANELLKDTFNAFYKYEPRLEREEEIEPSYRLNRRIMQKVMEMPEYREIRKMTRLDELNSAVATASFMGALSELIEELTQAQKEIEQAQNNVENNQNQGGGQGQQGQGQQNAQQQLQQALQNAMQKVSTQAIVAALQQARDDVQGTEEAMAAFLWGRDPGELKRLSPEERIELAQRLLRSKKLLEMAKMIGKMKHLMVSTYKNKIRRVKTEMYEVGIGDDLFRLLPQEYLKLRRYKLLFYKDYIEGKLLQYELKDRPEMQKGDFVVCLDLSGSMSGTPEMWAKAVALATLEVAIREKRRWALIPFDYHIREDLIKKFDRKNRPSPMDIIDIAEIYLGGGTNFEEPLEKAKELIGEFPDGDILFITDGYAPIDDDFAEEFKEWKKRTGTKVVVVAINTDITDDLKKIGDRFYRVSDFSDAEAVEIFANF